MKKHGVALSILLALLAMTPVHAADQDEFTVFGVASDFDPDQTAVGAGASASWEWTDTIYFTSQLFVSAADDVDRGQFLFGGEWRDSVGRVTGYVGLQGGVDLIDSAGGSTEDGFIRAYYDIGWPVLDSSEMRLGIAYDSKADFTQRESGARLGWRTTLGDGMTVVARAELYENEKNVFAGISWGF